MRRDLLKRLEALESQHGQDEPGPRLVVLTSPYPGPVIGYRGEGIETRRLEGESDDDCWQRHVTALKAAHPTKVVTISAQLTEED